MKKIFLSAILAGAVIAFGGTVFLSVENTVVGSLFFTIGLFVVCTRGLHLFTGKVCYVFDNDMAYAKTLPVIWLGNLAGTSLIALAEKCTRLVSLSARAQGICELKLSEPLFGAFILAVFCNVMIYIGVESYRSNPHELGKYLALFFGVCVFILCGFEHCVANMYYFTMGGAWSGRAVLYQQVPHDAPVPAGDGVFRAWIPDRETAAAGPAAVGPGLHPGGGGGTGGVSGLLYLFSGL